jgi:amino acid transporter
MHTHATDAEANGGPGVGTAVRQVTEHAKALVGLEVELAKLELKGKIASLGAGLGLLVAAAVIAVFAVGFLLATVAAALATFLATWLAILIVAVALVALAAVLGFVGARLLQRGTPPVPKEAIHEAKLTTAALKSDAGH